MAIAKAFASEIAKASAMAFANPDLLFARVIEGAMAKVFATAIFAVTRLLCRGTSSHVGERRDTVCRAALGCAVARLAAVRRATRLRLAALLHEVT